MITGWHMEGDATGEGFLKSHIREDFRSTNETESGETCSTTVTGMRWRLLENLEGLARVAPCCGRLGRKQAQWLPSRLIPHRHRARAELQPAHEPQVDTLR